MENQVIREAKSLHPIEPIRNNLLVRYTYEATGMIITNKTALGELRAIEKTVAGYGDSVHSKFNIGVNIITKENCFSLQPQIIVSNEFTVAKTVAKLKKFQPIQNNGAGKLILSKSDQADEAIDLNKVYTMFEYYLINEGDIIAIDKDHTTSFDIIH